MNTAEMIYEQVKEFPEPLAKEVLDFVEYLAMKTRQGTIKNLMAAQQESLQQIWDNSEDEVWNDG